MMRKNLKFIVGISVIIIAIGYLVVTGLNQDLSYYKTVEEILAMGDEAFDVNLQVAGYVVSGSIDKSTKPMKFSISHNAAVIPVTYIGEKPVPDTFKDECETVVHGRLSRGGVFEAEHIQAKCASKYEAKLEEVTVK